MGFGRWLGAMGAAGAMGKDGALGVKKAGMGSNEQMDRYNALAPEQQEKIQTTIGAMAGGGGMWGRLGTKVQEKMGWGADGGGVEEPGQPQGGMWSRLAGVGGAVAGAAAGMDKTSLLQQKLQQMKSKGGWGAIGPAAATAAQRIQMMQTGQQTGQPGGSLINRTSPMQPHPGTAKGMPQRQGMSHNTAWGGTVGQMADPAVAAQAGQAARASSYAA